ncbi:MAG: FHA domain-containing protein [Betaproteobacteria bacterium]
MSAHLPFWIELLDKSGAVVSRQRIQAEAVTVGRGYDNDVVIDDVFVSPAHLRIAFDAEGALWLEDLATGNGTFDVIRQANVKRLLVGDEASVRIGHTGLRIRRTSFEVTPALPMTTAPAPLLAMGYGNAALFMMVAFIAATTMSTWLSQTSEFKLAAYLPVGVIFPLVVLGWAGIWTLITRLVTSHGQFFRHVAIAFAFMVSLFAIDLVADFATFAFAWTALQRWVPLLVWAIFGVLCFAHVRAITMKHNRLVGSIIGALVIVAIGVHVSLRAESDRVQTQRIAAKLMPPFLLMKSPVPADKFFKDAFALKPKLDEERKKEPSSGGMSMSDFD